jgi:hypothetical protein
MGGFFLWPAATGGVPDLAPTKSAGSLSVFVLLAAMPKACAPDEITTPMSFRLSLSERMAIQAEAQRRGLSQSGLIRNALASVGVPIRHPA